MVDPIGIKPIQPGDRPLAATPVRPAKRVEAATDDAARATGQAGLRALAREAAETPRVRAERVAEIRKALESGTYPILPYTIADHMIALRMHWKANDPA